MGVVMDALLRLLRSQKTNLLCCLATVVLLGTGSLLMDLRRDLYQGLQADDLRFFFQPLRSEHLWLYLLFPVLTVWGLSSLVVAVDRFLARRRLGWLRAAAHGPLLLHVAFPLALVAHLASGFGGGSALHPVLPSGAVVAGVHLRPLAIREERHPNGMPRQVHVTLEASEGGKTRRVELAYNRPLMLAAGATALLLADYGHVQTAVVRAGAHTAELVRGVPTEVGGRVLVLERIHSGPGLSVPVAAVTEHGAGGRGAWLPVGRSSPEAELACLELKSAPAVLLTERRNPGTPLVGLAALLAALGVLLSVRDRWARPRAA
jgi:hypothetical protein